MPASNGLFGSGSSLSAATTLWRVSGVVMTITLRAGTGLATGRERTELFQQAHFVCDNPIFHDSPLRKAHHADLHPGDVHARRRDAPIGA